MAEGNPLRVLFPPALLAEDLCKACSRPIIWCRTEGGRLMPVDRERSHHGNLIVFETIDNRPGKYGPYRVKVAQDTEREALAGNDLWVSHFATCSKATQFRRPKPRKVPA